MGAIYEFRFEQRITDAVFSYSVVLPFISLCNGKIGSSPVTMSNQTGQRWLQNKEVYAPAMKTLASYNRESLGSGK